MTQINHTRVPAGFKVSLIAGVIGCVIVNVAMAGFFLMDMGAKSGPFDAAVLFVLSLTLIFGSIVTSRTVGLLWARDNGFMLACLGVVVWAVIAVFSVMTTSLSMTAGAESSINQEASESERVSMIRSQIRSSQATVVGFQDQHDALPSNRITDKGKALQNKAAAQQQVMSLNRALAAALNSESSIGASVAGMEHEMGISNLTTKAGLYVAIAIELLQFFLVASLGFLGSGHLTQNKKPRVGDIRKKPSSNLRAVA